jgi:carbamoyltransferase
MLLVAPLGMDIRRQMSEEEQNLLGLDKRRAVRSSIPAITHVDYSARIQTVNPKTNPIYYNTISKFAEKCGCPVIINTSFNVRGEPIVCTPQDAYRCFMRTNMDCLIMGSFLLDKQDQEPLVNNTDWQNEFELD